MRTIRMIIMLAAVLCFFNAAARGQSRLPADKSSLELSVGIWTGKQALAMPTPVDFARSSHSGGPLEAEISYSRSLTNKFALTAGIELLAAQTTSFIDPVGVFPDFKQTTLVVPILIGVRYFLLPHKEFSRATPYISAALGVNMGYQTSRQLYQGYVGAQKFAFAPAGKLGTGLDYQLDDHVYLALKVNYFFMGDFPVTVGERAGYDGIQILLGSGMVF